MWLWGRSPERIAAIRRNRCLTFPVSMTVPDAVHLTDSLSDAIDGADVVLLVVTSNGTRSVLEAIRDSGKLPSHCALVNASKGIEYPSLKPMSRVMAEYFPNHALAVLSGPTLAPEILNGLPTASVVACADAAVAEQLQQQLSTEMFRLYTNTDVIGVELGGSLKNIFAIVSGYMQARKLGDNARATLITRGLAEITRFGLAMGADVQTLYGLSGLGDLMATCNSPISRNYQVGYRLAQGQSLDRILSDLKVVAEGVKTTYAVDQLADQLGVEMPVVRQVRRAIAGELSETEMIHTLMSRRLKPETADV